jgi:hypothetical protein
VPLSRQARSLLRFLLTRNLVWGAVAWVHSKKAVIVTTSSNRERLGRYLASADVKLSHKEIEAIEKAGKKGPPAAQQLQQKINRSNAGKAALGLLAMIVSSFGLVAAGHGELAAMGAAGGLLGVTALVLVYLISLLFRRRA